MKAIKKFKGQDYNSIWPGFKLFIMEPKYIYVELVTIVNL